MQALHTRVLLLANSAVRTQRSGCRRFTAYAYTSNSPLTESGQARGSERLAGTLSSTALHRAALLARLSGLCYYPPEQLAERLMAEDMKLVVSGGTNFTRWYVADGVLDREAAEHTAAVQTYESPPKSASNGNAPSNGTKPLSKGPVERVILLRGVVWQGQDVDAWKLWQDLMRFWPTAIAKDFTQPPGVLLAHSGAADMASKLQESLRIPVNEAEALYRPITFGGHSLGGSLALLLAVLFRLQHKVPPELLRCCTFGSPPVLSHGQGGGGEGILKVLGLPKGAVQTFVLENDPVPRALLSVDPTFTALKQSRPGAALLQLRHWLLGPGVPLTPERFLADNVGDVHLICWNADNGHMVVPLAPEEMEEQFRIVSSRDSPTAFQGMVDHAHGSYSLDLDAAARQLQRRGL